MSPLCEFRFARSARLVVHARSPLRSDVFFWVPQVIGGTGFVISAGLLMIEVQPKWWYIKPLSLGWQSEFRTSSFVCLDFRGLFCL